MFDSQLIYIKVVNVTLSAVTSKLTHQKDSWNILMFMTGRYSLHDLNITLKTLLSLELEFRYCACKVMLKW